MTEEQLAIIKAVLKVEGPIHYGTYNGRVEFSWPYERISAKTLIVLAHQLGYNDVQIVPGGFEGEDCHLYFE